MEKPIQSTYEPKPIPGKQVTYKLVLPPKTHYKSYHYQKVFRAMYGYTQNVTKSNGHRYQYYRKGILTDSPIVRIGKCVIVLQEKEIQPLKTFFESGKNPGHTWWKKQPFKMVHVINDYNVTEFQVIRAIEEWVRDYTIQATNAETGSLAKIVMNQSDKPVDIHGVKEIKNMIQLFGSNEWFSQYYYRSPFLVEFVSHAKAYLNR